jgi:hypothetical protein
MKNFFDSDLAQRYGYAMALYIAAQAADLQHGIDVTNARRKAAGRRLLDGACVDEIISALRNNGQLPAESNAGGADRSDAGVTG